MFFSLILINNLINEEIKITPNAIANTIRKVSKPQSAKPCLSMFRSD